MGVATKYSPERADTLVTIGGVLTMVEHWRLEEKRTKLLRAYAEKLLRGGLEIEAGMVRVQQAAQRLRDLLAQAPALHRSSGPGPLSEQDTLWAVTTIRRSDGQKAEAVEILQQVIQNEIDLMANLAQNLRQSNDCLRTQYNRSDHPNHISDHQKDYRCWAPVEFTEALGRAVDLHGVIQDRLCNSRAKMLGEPSLPEPERKPAQSGSPAAEGPKTKRPAIQPAARQASFQPPPSPRPDPKPLTNEPIAALSVPRHEATLEQMNRIMRSKRWVVLTTP